MTRRSLRALSWILIGAVIYAQAAIAAYACPGQSPATDPGRQVSLAAEVALDASSEQGRAPMANCSGMSAAMDPSSPSLCAEHCQFGQQSNQAPSLSVPAVLLHALYVAPPVPAVSAASHPAAADLGALAVASPPHAILHCCFRI